jgi:hypothetical protein
VIAAAGTADGITSGTVWTRGSGVRVTAISLGAVPAAAGLATSRVSAALTPCGSSVARRTKTQSRSTAAAASVAPIARLFPGETGTGAGARTVIRSFSIASEPEALLDGAAGVFSNASTESGDRLVIEGIPSFQPFSPELGGGGIPRPRCVGSDLAVTTGSSRALVR